MGEKPWTKRDAINVANLLLLRCGQIGQYKGSRGFGRLEIQHLLSGIYGEKIPLDAFQGHDDHVAKHDSLTWFVDGDEKVEMTMLIKRERTNDKG